MTNPTSKPYNPATLIDYCKRQLGAPVLEVNVDDTQCSDRLGEAVQWLTQFHSDFMAKTLIKHQVTAQDVANQYIDLNAASGTVSTLNTSNVITGTETNFTNEFAPGITQITINGTTANVVSVIDQTNLVVDTAWTSTQNNVSASVVQAADRIIGVNRIYPLGTSLLLGNGIFNVKYQFFLGNAHNLAALDYSGYTMMRQHLETMEMLFSGSQQINFTKHQDRLFIECKWDELMPPGTWVLIEAWTAVNPDSYPKVYNDPFLKRYLTELIRKQWAQNLSKFGNMPLPGGVTVNYQDMMKQALDEIKDIEDEIRDTFESPPEFYVG